MSNLTPEGFGEFSQPFDLLGKGIGKTARKRTIEKTQNVGNIWVGNVVEMVVVVMVMGLEKGWGEIEEMVAPIAMAGERRWSDTVCEGSEVGGANKVPEKMSANEEFKKKS